MTEKCRKIDIHLHVKSHGNLSCETEAFDFLQKSRASRAVVLSFGAKGFMGLCGNREAAELCERYPKRFSWMCGLDAEDDKDVGALLAGCKAKGAVGVGEFIANRKIDDPYVQEVFKCAQALEMPLLFHMDSEAGASYGIADVPGLFLLEESLKRYPRMKIIGHSQPFWCEISGDAADNPSCRTSWVEGPVKKNGRLIELLEKYDNLYCDLSANSGRLAIMRDHEFGVHFLSRFADRLLYGTDSIIGETRFPLDEWLYEKYANGSIGKEAIEKIYYKNAERVFDLK